MPSEVGIGGCPWQPRVWFPREPEVPVEGPELRREREGGGRTDAVDMQIYTYVAIVLAKSRST